MKSAVRYSLKKYTNYIGFKTMSFKIAIINISLSVVTFSLQSNRCSSKNAAKPARELFETTCAECGGVAKIPFKPMEGKSYYCSDCFAKRK